MSFVIVLTVEFQDKLTDFLYVYAEGPTEGIHTYNTLPEHNNIII